MLARISLMFFVIAGLCAGSYTLGSAATTGQGDAMGIPAEHPIALALRFRQELGLTNEQVAQLDHERAEMAKEFAPFRERAESLQHRMKEFQESGKQDQAGATLLQREAEDLGAAIKPMMERYAQSVGQILSPEQREKMMKLAEANTPNKKGEEFTMMFIIESREPLGISPQQFTKLQYLQADFIRAFAPLREQMELLQLEVQEKFGKAGQAPSSEYQERGQSIQGKVKELQAKFSEQAIKDVLQPNQRAKLEELLRGQHRPAQNEG